jgi:hypothetical protein
LHPFTKGSEEREKRREITKKSLKILLLERKKKEREKGEKRFGEMIETLTFAPRSKRRVEKKEREEAGAKITK